MLSSIFPLGITCITTGAKEKLHALSFDYQVLLHRHQRGDWGDLDSDDRNSNEEALHTGERLFSSYLIQDTKFWVITEADRLSTTILLPREY